MKNLERFESIAIYGGDGGTSINILDLPWEYIFEPIHNCGHWLGHWMYGNGKCH